MPRPILLMALAACDSLASSDYTGEPLIRLDGTFAANSAAPAGQVGGIALMWQDAEGAGGPGKTSTVVPVSIEFPAAFSVSVPVPPSDAVMFAFADGDALAECYVFVVADLETQRPTRVIGADRGHALVYAPAAVPDGSTAAAYLGGPVAAGFHLRRFAATDEPSLAQRELIERCVTNGDPRAACEARRRYQLAPAADGEPLRIVLWSP